MTSTDLLKLGPDGGTLHKFPSAYRTMPGGVTNSSDVATHCTESLLRGVTKSIHISICVSLNVFMYVRAYISTHLSVILSFKLSENLYICSSHDAHPSKYCHTLHFYLDLKSVLPALASFSFMRLSCNRAFLSASSILFSTEFLRINKIIL